MSATPGGTEGATTQTVGHQLNLTRGMVVQELGWDEDVDDGLRVEIEDAIDADMASSPPGPRFSELRKNRCSNMWAKPVRPGVSLAEPTWAASTTATTGSDRSMWKATRRPLDRR